MSARAVSGAGEGSLGLQAMPRAQAPAPRKREYTCCLLQQHGAKWHFRPEWPLKRLLRRRLKGVASCWALQRAHDGSQPPTADEKAGGTGCVSRSPEADVLEPHHAVCRRRIGGGVNRSLLIDRPVFDSHDLSNTRCEVLH